MAQQELVAKEKQAAPTEEGTRPGRTYLPDVDICETPDALWLWADMPGVDENTININVEEGVLSIEGRVSLQEYDNLVPVYTEYNVGNYERRFALSNEINTDRITARLTNGVLELELPKADSAKPRRITIATG